MPELSSADHGVSPPRVRIPRQYNAASDLIQRNLLAGRGNKPAFIDDAGSHTYGELAERVIRFGYALTGLGMKQEERVMLCLLDTIDFPTAFLGCIQAGIVPIDATQAEIEQARHILGLDRPMCGNAGRLSRRCSRDQATP